MITLPIGLYIKVIGLYIKVIGPSFRLGFCSCCLCVGEFLCCCKEKGKCALCFRLENMNISTCTKTELLHEFRAFFSLELEELSLISRNIGLTNNPRTFEVCISLASMLKLGQTCVYTFRFLNCSCLLIYISYVVFF